MNKLLKFRSKKDRKNWVFSDPHFRHQGPRGALHPLWETRGYANYDDMTEQIINTLNEHVAKDDNLFCLGDWCLNSTWDQFIDDTGSINCQNIYMLWGNHNSRVSQAYRVAVELQYGITDPDVEVYPTRWNNIIFLGNYQEVVVDGQYYVLCHYPMDVFNEGMKGAIMLCGHSHGSYEKTQVDYPYGKRLDVGWDQFKRPLSFDEVREICMKKQFVMVDHH